MHRKRRFLDFKRRKGFTQIELAVSVVIVGVLMISSLNSIAASRRSHTAESARLMGGTLAENLMAEICNLPLREPSCACGFGPETGEAGSNRQLLDDIDDYNNLVDSPPKRRNGLELTGFTLWSRSVTIQKVPANDWNSNSSNYQGVYRIIVAVKRGGTTICSLVGYRSDALTVSPSLNSL